MITDIFFDLDHTLWDFERNSALTFASILAKNQVDVEVKDFLVVYNPINHQYWKLYREERITKEALRYARLRTTFNKLGVKVHKKTINTLSEQYIEELTTHNYLFSGTIDVLTYLYEKYNLHIITNGFEEVQQHKLEKSNIAKYFKQVINSEMAGVKKPNPKIFDLAMQKAQVSATSSLMIGDSVEADILGALNVGMKAIHFNSHQEEHHDHCPLIYDLKQLKELL